MVFRASTAREALGLVKSALGPDAVILSTLHVPDGQGNTVVEISAAANSAHDQHEMPPRAVAAVAPRSGTNPALRPSAAHRRNRSVPSLPAALQACYTKLIQNDVADELARQILTEAAGHGRANFDPPVLLERLRDVVARMIPAAGGIAVEPGRRRCVALVGPPGGGKTTLLAKLAAHFKLRRGLRVEVLSLDLYRLGADQQLARYAEIIDVPLRTAQNAAALGTARDASTEADLLLIDTPGIGLRDAERFAHIAELLRAAEPDETHLVLPASTSSSVQARVAEAFARLGVTRIAFTHLDEAVGLGVVLNLVNRFRWQISYLSTGQRVPSDLQEACSRKLAELILSP